MRTVPKAATILAASLLLLSGCGSTTNTRTPAPTPGPPFPRGTGQTVAQLVAGLQSGPILAPSVSLLSPGPDRFGFALFDPARQQLTPPSVALYLASSRQTNVRGPFSVREESLAVAPQFQSQTVANDPAAGRFIYVSEPRLGTAKVQVAVVVARINGRLVASTPAPVQLAPPGVQPPRVGERAIVIHTPTLASVGGVASKIDTRVPPDDMHAVDFADVVGRRPALLLFATPQLCQSRLCGPVADIAEQLKARYGDRMAFIHMEIYNDNQVSRGFRPQVSAYHLPSEPWVFAVDRRGRIASRIEGAFSADELEAAVKRGLAP